MLKIKENTILYNFKTEEDCQKLLKYLFDNKWKWRSGNTNFLHTKFEDYKEETCYYLNEKSKIIHYGNVKNIGYNPLFKMINFKNFSRPLFVEIKE